MPTEEAAAAPAQPRKRARDAEATQRRLLEAAEQEFAAQGYQGARLRDIAVRAGVQPALIHHYFGDKKGLYRAMLAAAMTESSKLSWHILEENSDLDTMVRSFVAMLLRYNYEHQNLIAILRNEGRGGSPASNVGREVTRRLLGPVIEAVKAYLADRQQRGELRAEVDVHEVMTTALSLCAYPFMDVGFLEACLPEGMIDDEASLRRREQAIVDVILRACRPDPAD